MSLKPAAQAKQNREQKDLAMGNRAAPSRTLRNVIDEVTFTGSLLNHPVELRNVEEVVTSLKGSSAPGASVITWTLGATAGTINLYAWMPTDSATTTLIAATAPVTVGLIIHGS